MKVSKVDDRLIDVSSGEVICSIEPKFQFLYYEDYRQEFLASKEIRFLDPMTAQELTGDKLKAYMETECIAEDKEDGHRSTTSLTSKGNRSFSRRVSKETKWYSENTDQIPHIRDILIPEKYYGTILDSEVTLPIEDCSCRKVQSVTGALPETAIANQLEVGFAELNVFDMLYYCGINIQSKPLWERKLHLFRVLKDISSPFLNMMKIYCSKEVYEVLLDKWMGHKMYDEDILKYVFIEEDYSALFRRLLKSGKEGLIIKDINAKYEQKRSKGFIKMKGHTTYDVVVMGYEEPSHDIDFTTMKTPIEEWEYWFHPESSSYWEGINTNSCPDECLSIAVTKFACKGWIGAIKFGVWKDGELIQVGRTSGMDEDTRKMFSENKDKFIGTVIEVEAQHVINEETGSLQHPRYVQLRLDKDSETCTFEDHIRKY